MQDSAKQGLGLRGIMMMLLLSLRPLLRFFFICPVYALRCRFGARAGAGKGDELPQFILGSILQWYEVWQRPQHFASHLSGRYKVCYISPIPVHHIVDEAPLWLGRRMSNITENLVVFSPLVLPGENKLGVIRAINNALWVSYVREAAIKLKMSNPVLWLNFPFNDRLLKAIPYRSVIYDVMDEFIEFSMAPKDAADREKRLLDAASFVSTGTYSLFEKKKGLHKNVEFIPCGVDFDLFNSIAKRTPDRPQDFPSVRGPVFGYFGSLNERIDSGLIEDVARRRPAWTFILLGPWQRSYKGVRDLRNVHYLGLKQYRSLPAYLAHFDVCMMPYRVTEATKKINPVKLLEYFAAGKPVITARIPDVLRFYESLVWIAEDANEFIAQAETILRMKGSGQFNPEPYIDVARKRSWEEMAEQMINRILVSLQ
ncbi:MAG: glycosyltransferase [Candidatus Coatesbacteria bacterium]|nr:glycosyltransferase [Candidatus Coatesbacteria bacterium]